MKLFYQLVGLVLGFIIGILTATSSLAVLGLYVYSDTKKPRDKAKRDYRGYTKPSAKSQTNVLEDPFTHKYASRLEAEEMLDALMGIIDEHGFVTVRDLKIGLGIMPNYADVRKGWRNLRDAKISKNPTESFTPATFNIAFPEPQAF